MGRATQNGLFELCATTVEAAEAAQVAGAHRVELCEDLDVGGVTPSLAKLKATLQAVKLPVRVLIRPRAGDFIYSPAEFSQMRAEVLAAKKLGADGVVLGILLPNLEVDVQRTRELIEAARPMKVTFHRAFDCTAQIDKAFEAVLATGADCLLTSGGAADVAAGADAIRRLVLQAQDRIELMAGGGLRLPGLRALLQHTGVRSVHGSLSRPPVTAEMGATAELCHQWRMNLEADIRHTVRVLQETRDRRLAG